MKTVRSIADLRAATGGANRCALVPTMGNLHEGHLSLVRLARDAIARGQAAGPIVTSIFVNRLQFGPNDDFDQYPRTFEADCARLEASGCDIVFAPTERDLYPEPQRYTVTPDPAIAEILEGAFRPGFFTGVCTVVLKLFLAAQPAVAVFGKKDYQQLMVVRRMVDQFALPIDIIGAETARDRDGLALSSRNGYLDIEQRSRAVQLSAALQGLIAAWKRDPGAREALEREAAATLTAAGWKPDYLVIRRRRDLQPPDLAGAAATGTGATVTAATGTAATGTAATGNGPLVALGAARIGTTRLIDNLEFD